MKSSLTVFSILVMNVLSSLAYAEAPETLQAYGLSLTDQKVSLDREDPSLNDIAALANPSDKMAMSRAACDVLANTIQSMNPAAANVAELPIDISAACVVEKKNTSKITDPFRAHNLTKLAITIHAVGKMGADISIESSNAMASQKACARSVKVLEALASSMGQKDIILTSSCSDTSKLAIKIIFAAQKGLNENQMANQLNLSKNKDRELLNFLFKVRPAIE